MPIFRNIINKFNRGEIDSKALSRDDVTRVQNSCSLMTNWMPGRLGPMSFRPGLEYLGEITSGTDTHNIPFVAAIDDTAIFEITDTIMRVWVDDEIVTFASTTSSITNPNFLVSLTGWTDNSGSGSSTAWRTGNFAVLTGNNTTEAVLYQTMTTNTGVENALKIVTLQAPVTLKLGTSGVGSTDIVETVLLPGEHILSFTPAGNVTITLSSSSDYEALIDSVNLTIGALTFTGNIPTTANLSTVRYTQSADILYVVFNDSQQLQIERRGTRSWSVVEFRSDDGPFEVINTGAVGMTLGALVGDTTMTATHDFFSSDHAGALFKVIHYAQAESATVTAQDTGTDEISITGAASRSFSINISGTFTATVTLQSSADNVLWTDTSETWTAATSTSYDDGLVNSELFYRLHVKTGDFTSGTVELSLTYTGGATTGIVRVTDYTSATVVDVQVLQRVGSTDTTYAWFEGSWSDMRGYPTAVELYEGRLCFAGKAKFWASESDAYTFFGTETEGAAAAIQRTVGFGPVDSVAWLAESGRLIMGLPTVEIGIRTSSFDEPLANTNTNLKKASSQGVANIEPVFIDSTIYFAQRSGTRVYEADYDSTDGHTASDTTVVNPDICSAGIKRLAVTRQPETRVYVVLDDGTARVYLIDRSEDVRAWARIETDGDFLDVVVLPGETEDRVYFTVDRDGGIYFEKMALFSEAIGGLYSVHTDSALSFVSPGTTITVAHLDTQVVNVWADGQDRGEFTVTSNDITVPESWAFVVVGLPYEADYTSTKISGFVTESVLNVRKRIVSTGLVLENYWPGSLTIGPEASLLASLPEFEGGAVVPTDATLATYDYLPFEFDGEEESDPRIVMKCTGPCTILSLSYEVLFDKLVKTSGDT